MTELQGIVDRLEEIGRRLNIPVKQLCYLAGCSRAAWSRYKNGLMSCRWEQAKRLQHLLNVLGEGLEQLRTEAAVIAEVSAGSIPFDLATAYVRSGSFSTFRAPTRSVASLRGAS